MAGIQLATNFEVNTSLPLDSRMVFADLDTRDALDPIKRYEGLLTYVSSEKKFYVLEGGVANLNWKELSSGGGGSFSGTIDAINVAEDVARKFVTESEKTQITTNATNITALQGEKYKIKGSNTDNNPDYLDGKVDGTTIQVSSDKLVVKNVDGLTIGISTINNVLSGVTNNIKTDIDTINSTLVGLSSGMIFKGKVATYADLTNTTNKQNGDVYVVLADESKEGGRSLYVYNSSITNFDFIGEFTFSSEFIALTDTPTDYVGQNNKFVKVDEANNQIVFSDIDWNDVKNKPNSSITDIDQAVLDKHSHANKATLDKISDDGTNLLFNGTVIAGGGGTYTNATPIPQALGGIGVGETFYNIPVQDMLNKLLYPYLKPLITLSLVPDASIKEYGDNISSIILRATTTKKSKDIVKVEFYRNGTLINTKTTPSVSGGVEDYTETTLINSTTNYLAKVYDGTSVVDSNVKTITYVYPMYIGTVANSVPVEVDVKLMDKLLKVKSNQQKSYTISNARFCFAYPSTYGSLSSILDQNGFEILSSFNKYTHMYTMLDGKTVEYFVYVLTNNTTQSNFTVNYKF